MFRGSRCSYLDSVNRQAAEDMGAGDDLVKENGQPGEEEVKDDDVEMKEDKTAETMKDETKSEDAKSDEIKEEETKECKLDEEKKEDVKTDEKKEGDEKKKEVVSDDKAEVVELEEKTEETVSKQKLVMEIQDFITYITWEYSDAEYYLKEVKGKFAMSMEDQNLAMTQILESFVARSNTPSMTQQNTARPKESFVAHCNKPSMAQQNTARPKEFQEQISPSLPSRQYPNIS